MTLVAVSGAYGAGGSVIGPALAERLGVPFLDRAIPLGVAFELGLPVDEADADDRVSGGWLERVLRGFAGQDAGAPVDAEPVTTEEFRRVTEEVLRRHTARGEGVVLGRAAVIVLRDDPRALRVRLDGPPERRIRQAMRLEGLDAPIAERRMRAADRTHAAYASRCYGADLADPSLYDIVLDSTRIDHETCIAVLVAAALALPASAPAISRN